MRERRIFRMPELAEQMFSSQQIVIPPKFPYILKKYCKAAIKTQPYDLLRWSFEYFKALAENRPPPVKLRLEYPIYSTEGGLTRGCLKVLANQLTSYTEIPIPVVKNAWRGFCLDPIELIRVLCLCEVYKRADFVPFLHFIAVAGGMLTKCLTHTMILLCESLTKEPDGGSAAIPLTDFLVMYHFLAQIDASKDIKYYNGYREDQIPKPQENTAEEEQTISSSVEAQKDKKLKALSAMHMDQLESDKEGMVAGRQMSATSGEFIAQHVERDVMAFVDEQIAILPDPDLKKKKAKPQEVAMIRDILDTFLNENIDVIVPEIEEVEEEELPIPDITVVYAVPGIGPRVNQDIVEDFVEYASEVCKIQADVIMPRNLRHFLCPPLEKYIEQENGETDPPEIEKADVIKLRPKKEQAVVGGVVTD